LKGSLRGIWLPPEEKYGCEGIQQRDQKSNRERIEILNQKKGQEQASDDGSNGFKKIDLSD